MYIITRLFLETNPRGCATVDDGRAVRSKLLEVQIPDVQYIIRCYGAKALSCIVLVSGL